MRWRRPDPRCNGPDGQVAAALAWSLCGLFPVLLVFLSLTVGSARAETPDRLRLALFHSELSRQGPGLLLRDIRAGAEDVLRVRDVVAEARPDAVVLLGFDYDLDAVALAAFQDLLAAAGHAMPHRHARLPNRGMATGLDMDGDGRTGTPDDAQGFGRFAGAAGMAVLSRLPIDTAATRDFSAFLWRDLPGALLPRHQGQPFPSEQVFDIQRLATTGFWDVSVLLPDGSPLSLLAWHAGPPAFGGPHQRNLRRNHDETMFWLHLLDGALPMPPPAPPYVLIGNANLDPAAGDGMHQAIRALLDHPALQDPAPASSPPRVPGAPATATAHFPQGPGWLRTSYILPDAGLQVLDSGLIRAPAPARHALVWVDIALP